MSKPITVQCPSCQTDVVWNEESVHRPFCSDRCKLLDLGAWASESYSIAAEEQDEWSLAEETSSANQKHTPLH